MAVVSSGGAKRVVGSVGKVRVLTLHPLRRGYEPGRPPGSARSGRPEPIRSAMVGATVSGSGRSLMSSPGNAAWCIAVRRSPGSTLYQVNCGSSAAQVSVWWSRAALVDP